MVGVAVLVAACQAPQPGVADFTPTPKVQTVSLADNQTLAAAPMHVAFERGYMAAAAKDS